MTIDRQGWVGSWWEKAKPKPQSSTCRYRVTPRSPTFAQDTSSYRDANRTVGRQLRLHELQWAEMDYRG